MNLTYYLAYMKWITPFLVKWDYTIIFFVGFILACIGFGTLCYFFDYWLFKEIWDE